MEKFTTQAPCPYHGLLKPAAKFTNVIYNAKGGGHAQQHQHHHKQQQQQQYRANGGGSEAPKTVEPIWDIVSGLAQALNDAKDQLATLMQSRSNSPHKNGFAKGNGNSNGNSCVNTHGGLSVPRSATPRCYSAPHRRARVAQRNGGEVEENEHDPYTRNIHRSHAHGYCAFGRNTEFKERMHHSRNGTRQIQSSPGRARGRGGGNGGGEDDGGGNYGIRLQGRSNACGIKVVPNGKSYTCTRDRGRSGLHLQAKMKNCNMNVDTDGEKFGPNNPVKIHFTAPTKVRYPTPYRQQQPQPSAEVKRYCVGTQYANLLREEAHHLREKRIREENKIMKNHC